MSHVLSAMEETPNDEVPPGVSSYTLSLRVAAPRGPLDFVISCFGIVKASQYTSPHLQTRKRWPWANLKVLTFQPLISGEGGEDIVATVVTVKTALHNKHTDHSFIHQLYSYLYLNGLLVGIYSNYMHTHIFIRDCNGNLLITEPVTNDSVGDMESGRTSRMELVSLAILLAADKRQMEFEPIGNLVVVPCGDEEGGSNDPRRLSLPAECDGKRDVKHPKESLPPSPRNCGEHYTRDGQAVDLLEVIRR